MGDQEREAAIVGLIEEVYKNTILVPVPIILSQ
jgi:hypothetical protein